MRKIIGSTDLGAVEWESFVPREETRRTENSGIHAIPATEVDGIAAKACRADTSVIVSSPV